MPSASWSLPAFYSCPGSVFSNEDYDGTLADWDRFQTTMDKDDRLPVCSGCYAMSGNYRFPNVKSVREYNMENWKEDTWVNDMVRLIKDDRYFRFFDSGDIYCVELAEKILKVCKRCPNTKFWIPTLSWRITTIYATLVELNKLPNVVVRFSSGYVNNVFHDNTLNTSDVIPMSLVGTEEAKGKNKVVCRSFERKGKCGDCRACWSKDVKKVLYPAHGVTIVKQVKLMEV